MTFRTKYILCIALMASTLTVIAQKRAGYFGKSNIISVEKDIHLGSLFGRIGKYNAKAIAYPGIRLERIIGHHVMLGVSVGYSLGEMRDENNQFSNSAFQVDYKGSAIDVRSGSGLLKIKSYTYLVHLKRYKTGKSIIPYGKYRCFDFGITSNSVIIGKDYRFMDGFGFEYGPEKEIRIKYREFVFGYNLGKVYNLYKSKWLLDISMGVKVKFLLTNLFRPRYNEWAIRASDDLLTQQFLKLKIGINYAF